MILYHGTNTEIEFVDLEKCRPFKDVTNQISFHTHESLKLLKKAGTIK